MLITQKLKSYTLEKDQAMKNDEFMRFSNRSREAAYSNMDDMQCHRFEDYMQSGFNDKKLKGLLQELLGGKGKSYDGGRSKVHDEVVQVFRVAAKIYVGQLTEEARIGQIEDLALKYGCASIIPESERCLTAIQPHNLQEARRRLIK
jgi:hypothetical protein